MKRTFTRHIVGAAALTGALTFGAAGMASAANTGTGTPSGTGSATQAPAHAVNCTRAEKLGTHIQSLEAKANAWVPKAEQRETAAKTADHPKLAAAIGKRVAWVQKRMARGDTILSKIAQKCGSASPAS